LDYDDFQYCYKIIPNMFCDDRKNTWMRFPCGDGQSVLNILTECNNQRHIRTVKHLYDTNDRTLCWQYLVCAHGFEFLFSPFVNCIDLCNTIDDCASLLGTVCPNSTTIFPPNPIMLHPSVYLVYWTDENQTNIFPYFICYNECDHLYPPTLKLHGYSCRTLHELNVLSQHGYILLDALFNAVYSLFAGCITNNKTNATLVFRCPMTSQIISLYRVKDDLKDCFLGLDESFNENTCTVQRTQRFQCWTNSTECIPIRLVQNGIADCSDHSDEFYPLSCLFGTERGCDYIRGILQFSTIYYQFEVLSI
jgi:hypothetical protein